MVGGLPVKADAVIGQFTLVGVRDDDGVLEPYAPADIVASAYGYNAVYVALNHLEGGASDGDVVSKHEVVTKAIVLFNCNVDVTDAAVGTQVYGEDDNTVSVGAVADGNIVGTLLQYNGDNTGYVLVDN